MNKELKEVFESVKVKYPWIDEEDIIPISDFKSLVECGGFTDYDGTGYYLDSCGNKIRHVRCNNGNILAAEIEGAKYVIWFNK